MIYYPTPGRVVVKRHKGPTESEGGVVYTDKHNDNSFERESTVIAVNCNDDLSFEAGDTVLIQRGTGMVLDKDGLICVAAEAVLCVLHEEDAVKECA